MGRAMTEQDDDPDYAALLASAPRPMTVEWLCSPAYGALMQRHVTGPAHVLGGPDDDSEAQRCTPSYVFRHATAASALGVWRWRGMHRYRDHLLRLFPHGQVVLDFGGAAGPLGLGSIVVDSAMTDANGQPVYSGTLRCLTGAHAVFSSHTLEHCADLDGTLGEMRDALVTGGSLVLHVPAWTCERWRAGVHTSTEHGAHRWTFGIDRVTPIVDAAHNYVDIRHATERAGFDDVRAWYCGDDSIMLFARKR